MWDHTVFHVVPNWRANPAMVAPSKRNCRISQRIARTPKRARGGAHPLVIFQECHRLAGLFQAPPASFVQPDPCRNPGPGRVNHLYHHTPVTLRDHPHSTRKSRYDHPTVAVAAPENKRDARSIHPPTETRTFTGEALLYSIPINDDRHGSLHVPKILRAVLPIAFIVVVYTGTLMGTLLDFHAFSTIPPLTWFFLLVALGGANAASTFGLARTERTSHLAFWGLALKMCFLPIFLVSLFVVVMTGRHFSFSPESLVLTLTLIIPDPVLSYALMIVSSCYGFAAIIRARNEQLISPETAKKYKRGHAIPIAPHDNAFTLGPRPGAFIAPPSMSGSTIVHPLAHRPMITQRFRPARRAGPAIR